MAVVEVHINETVYKDLQLVVQVGAAVEIIVVLVVPLPLVLEGTTVDIVVLAVVILVLVVEVVPVVKVVMVLIQEKPQKNPVMVVSEFKSHQHLEILVQQ